MNRIKEDWKCESEEDWEEMWRTDRAENAYVERMIERKRQKMQDFLKIYGKKV